MKKRLLPALRSSGIFLTSMALPAAAIYAAGWVALHGEASVGFILAGIICTVTLSGLSHLTK